MGEENNGGHGGKRRRAGRKAGVYGPGGQSISRQVSLPEDDWEKAEQWAERLGMTRSAFLRMVLKQYMDSNPVALAGRTESEKSGD